jgi:porin
MVRLARRNAEAVGGARWPVMVASLAAALAPAGAVLAQSQPIADPTQSVTPQADTASTAPPGAFSLSLAYTLDLLSDVSGGRARGAAAPDLLKLSLAYDGGARGHEGLTGLLSLEHTFGSGFTAERVGGAQTISSLEAPGATRLYEAWVQQEFLDGMAGLKAGLVDLNTTFDVQQTAALFVNASHGVGPELGDTGRNGPANYPFTALALTGFWRASDAWTAQLGVFDGVAQDPAHRAAFAAVNLNGGALIIGQVERRFGDRARVELGGWTYTAAFPALGRFRPDGSPEESGGNAGVYGLVEGQLISRGEQGGGLNGWIRAGRANGDINAVSDYLGAGLVYTAPLPGRGEDEVGLAMARAGFGKGARLDGLAKGRVIDGAETVIEATYRYVVRDWLSVQPDLQYVIRPSGDAAVPNALVIGLRLAVTYAR